MSRQDRFSWFSAQQPKQRRKKSPSRAFGRGYSLGRRLHIEPLEDRRMLAVITVDSLLDNAFPDGGITLREAILAANTNAVVGDAPAGDAGADTIRFAAALSGQTINLAAELQITEALTIDATALAQNVTIYANNTSRIFNITATSGNFTLAGLTLTGGRTTGDNANSSDTTFSGGAIRSLTNGNLTIDQSTVSRNGTAGKHARGGGVFSTGEVTFTSSTVYGNSTAGLRSYGGGVFSAGGVTLSSSIVSGNNAIGSASTGGGIQSNGGIVTLTNSTVSENKTHAGYGGGGGILSTGSVTLVNSTVSRNTTTGSFSSGGGIRSFSSVSLINSTVSGNRTNNTTGVNPSYGGGIFSSGDVTLTSSTVTGNHVAHANATGGGIWNNNDPITITNSIVSGNTAGGGSPDIDPGTGTFSVNFSLIGTAVTPDAGTSGNNVVTNAPLLSPLTDNGGPTETHALLAGSPAIDAGDPGFDVVATPNDQRGAPFARGAGLRVDIGAYERQTLAPSFFVVTTTADELDYSNADVSLREAINSANGSLGFDSITFAAALSGNTITLGGTELHISEEVTIDATSLAASVTIDADELSRIFNITATTGDFTLAGLTLTGGRTTGDNVFLGTTFSGGAVRSLTSGNLTIDQSTINENSTAGSFARGGGIFSSGNVTLTSSTVSGNSTTGFYANGGGIYSYGAVTFTNSTVSGNGTAGSSAYGGGIRSRGNVTLTNSTVSGNSTTGNYAIGGGILSSGTVTLTSSTISGNSTAGYEAEAGGIFSVGAVTLTSSTISGNSTAGDVAHGGGILSRGTVTLTSSTVSGNSTTGNSSSGGGILSSGTVTLTSSTVTDNHAHNSNASGGGIWNFNDQITLTNSIVSENTAGGGSPDINPGTGTFSVKFSLIGTAVVPDAGTSGNNVATNDPLLGLLANNGGPTETHALLIGSLAIDAGDPSIVFNPAEFDQRGAPFARVVGSRIDIGAVEDQPVVVNSADFDGDNDIDGADFLAWQRGFGTPNANKPDGDADNDNDVDAADLVVWSNQFGQPAPVAAASEFSAISDQPLAELIDAVMAIELARDVQVTESPTLDEEIAFAETYADHVFAAEAITPTAMFADEAERPETDSSEGEDSENPWLADELLEQVFG